MWQRSVGFEIKELLGEGSQGSVYRALRRDPATGLSQTVAVKILHSETTVNAWRSEFESLSKVRSEYCVQVFGFERLNQRPALVLEYVDGVSLATLGKSCWLGEQDIQEILAQSECAVLDLYRFGTFHGDLSPHNILIDTDGRLRLLDFGLANCSTESARATPEFAAPERLCGAPADLPADIFSLGRIEQFLRGIPASPDSSSCYLQATPSRRSLRGLFSNSDRRAALGEKIRAFRQRQALAAQARTRTQIHTRSAKPASALLAALTAVCLLMAPNAGQSLTASRVSVLQIRTHQWHYFHLNGAPLGYSPVSVPIEAGRVHRLEWQSRQGRGEISIKAGSGGVYQLSDRDFSH